MNNYFINHIKYYGINIGLCFIEIIKGINFAINKNLVFKNNLVYDNIIISTNIKNEAEVRTLAGTFNFIPGVITLGFNKDNGKFNLILNCINGNSEETINHFIKVKERFENNLIKLEK